jgi:Ca-activated chloride channel homolog
VDTALLDSLSQNHRGTTTYVRPFQAIDEIVSGFYAKISAPVLTDLRLDFGGVIVEQLYPAALPDLFAGSQLILAGRYRQGGPATITLTGMVNGRTQTFAYEDNAFRNQGGDPFIPRLWATRAIGHLLTQIRLHGEDAELVQSVVNLSVRYGVITPYTSFLIEEDDIFSQAARDVVVQEVMVERAEAPSPSVSGAQAVDAAADMAEMVAAEAGAPLPTITASEGAAAVQETVRLAGGKTFVLRRGVWLDTAYDPGMYQLQPVQFASDAYFELVTAVPESGQYLALGPRVIFVYEGAAYEIIAGDEAAGATSPTAEPTSPPAVEPSDPETAVTPIFSDGRSRSWAWLGAVAFGALILAGLGVWRQRRQRSW